VAAIVYHKGRGPLRFGWKLDSEDGGEHPRKVEIRVPLACGEGPLLSTELPIQVFGPHAGFPLRRDTNKD
jgi:hypothetical protein